MSGAGERWRIAHYYTIDHKRLAEVREGGPEGGSRFVCEATVPDAEAIVADHNASARLAESEARVRELEGLLRDFLDQCINDDCSLCERGDAALRGAEGNDTAERP